MFKIFANHPELLATISEKKDGSMKLGVDDEVNLRNRSLWLAKQGLSPEQVISADLVHGKKVVIVNGGNGGQSLPACDGLITKETNVFLSVTVADCLPVFFYDAVQKVLGLAHAGWRGLAQNIVREIVNLMSLQFGSQPVDLFVGVGPAIGPCHFEVHDDVAQEFKNYPAALEIKDDKEYLNLKQILLEQLKALGISRDNVEIDRACTYCEAERYFSYRRDKPEQVEAMMAIIGLKNK